MNSIFDVKESDIDKMLKEAWDNALYIYDGPCMWVSDMGGTLRLWLKNDEFSYFGIKITEFNHQLMLENKLQLHIIQSDPDVWLLYINEGNSIIEEIGHYVLSTSPPLTDHQKSEKGSFLRLDLKTQK